MKKVLILFSFLLALATQIQAQPVNFTLNPAPPAGIINPSGYAEVAIDGGVPSLNITRNATGGFNVLYTESGVDYTQGWASAYIEEVDSAMSAKGQEHMGQYGYCGSTQGNIFIGYTCYDGSTYLYPMFPLFITTTWIPPLNYHHYMLILNRGKDAKGMYHFLRQEFMLYEDNLTSTPAINTPAPAPKKKGNSVK